MVVSETEASNIVTVEAAYSALARHDLDAFLASFTEEGIVVREPSFMPYGGTVTSKSDLLPTLARIAEYLDGGRLEVRSISASGDIVHATLTVPARATGMPVELAEMIRLKNGKIVAMDVYVHDAQGLAVSVS